MTKEELKFGDYCTIEQNRFGVDNVFFTHKVIRTLQSNTWVDVPVMVNPVETMHSSMEDVVSCICCGVDETQVFKYRVSDVRKCAPDMDSRAYKKPLSELANNEEDCRKLFEYFFPTSTYEKKAIIFNQEDSTAFIGIHGFNNEYRVYILIELDGHIEFSMDDDTYPIDNIFALVDFIRQLGYDPIKNNK